LAEELKESMKKGNLAVIPLSLVLKGKAIQIRKAGYLIWSVPISGRESESCCLLPSQGGAWLQARKA